MSDPIRDALAQLVALHLDESPRRPGADADAWAEAWAAARAALAQPEPVAQALYQGAEHEPPYAQYARGVQEGYELGKRHALQDAAANESQPAPQPAMLSDEQITRFWFESASGTYFEFARAIERAVRGQT